MKLLVSAVVASGLVLALPAGASEKKIKQSEVPAAVMETVAKKYPGLKATGFEQEQENGATVYEVKLGKGEGEMDVDVSPEGKFVSEEKWIKAETVPEAVQKGLGASKFKGWKVQKAEQVTLADHESSPSFELQLSKGHEHREVVFASDGSLVKEEAAKGGDHRGDAKRDVESAKP